MLMTRPLVLLSIPDVSAFTKTLKKIVQAAPPSEKLQPTKTTSENNEAVNAVNLGVDVGYCAQGT
jgi:hypothetical protein